MEGGRGCLGGTIVKEKLCQNPCKEQFVVRVKLHLSHLNFSQPLSMKVEKQESSRACRQVFNCHPTFPNVTHPL